MRGVGGLVVVRKLGYDNPTTITAINAATSAKLAGMVYLSIKRGTSLCAPQTRRSPRAAMIKIRAISFDMNIVITGLAAKVLASSPLTPHQGERLSGGAFRQTVANCGAPSDGYDAHDKRTTRRLVYFAPNVSALDVHAPKLNRDGSLNNRISGCFAAADDGQSGQTFDRKF